MTSGTSMSIKVYYLDYSSYYGVLILNKDTNTSSNGVVAVTMEDRSGLYCYSISADNLSSTTGHSFGGYSWMANNSNPQGVMDVSLIAASPAGVY